MTGLPEIDHHDLLGVDHMVAILTLLTIVTLILVDWINQLLKQRGESKAELKSEEVLTPEGMTMELRS